jgi:hypothetical protein
MTLKIKQKNGVAGHRRQEPLEKSAENALMPHNRSYFTRFLDVARREKTLHCGR